MRELIELLRQAFVAGIAVCDNALAGLEQLRANGVPLGLATSSSGDRLRAIRVCGDRHNGCNGCIQYSLGFGGVRLLEQNSL